jgi:hypothetical protein
MRRPLILGLLLAANVLNVMANAIVFDGYLHKAVHGLLPWSPLLLAVGSLASATWVCVLVLRLPDQAAARLWAGFAALGCGGVLAAASEWVLYRQYNDNLDLVLLIEGQVTGSSSSGGGFFNVSLPAFQPDSNLLLVISGLVVAVGWFTWSVLAWRDARRLNRSAVEPEN